MLRILHLADLHLGWTPRFLDARRAAQRREARDGLLARAVDYACDASNRIDLVVIAGDLFESHTPDTGLVGRVVAALERLPMPLVTTPGNHDEITYAQSVYRRTRWPGVLVTNPTPGHVATVTCGGQPVHLYSLAYVGGVTPTTRALRDFPRLDADGLHVAVFHGTLGTWGGDRSLPIDLDALARAGYDYVAMGHIHQHQVHRLGGPSVAVYAGMVEGKGFDDPGVGHLTVAHLKRGAVTVERVPVAAQKVRTVEVDVTSMGAEQIEQAVLRVADRAALVRVSLQGAASCSVDAEQLRGQLADSFFHLDVVDRTTSISDDALDDWAADDTVLGLFVRRMRVQMAEAEPPRMAILQQALHRGVHALREAGGLS